MAYIVPSHLFSQMKNLMRLFFGSPTNKLDNTWRRWPHVPKNTQGSDMSGSYCKDDGSQCGDSAAENHGGKTHDMAKH